MKLIVGLGNPEGDYRGTRHNIGAIAVDFCAGRAEARFKRMKKIALIAMANLDGEQVLFAKPICFMNESGMAVAALKRFYRIQTRNLVIVHDDLDLPFGAIRVSRGKSSGGHNGVQSVIDHSKSKDFVRVRIGIGPKTEDAAEFVLEPWSRHEKAQLDRVVLRAWEAIQILVTWGFEKAANSFH